MQRLRPEHEIDVGGARDDRATFLTGDATPDADQHAGALALEVFDAAEVVKDLFLRLYAHRAGVEQDHVGIGRVGRGHHAVGGAKHVGHLRRIVLVHLTAESLDVQLPWHWTGNSIKAGTYAASTIT